MLTVVYQQQGAVPGLVTTSGLGASPWSRVEGRGCLSQDRCALATGSVFPGFPLCCGALVSPRLPSRRAVPTQGPRGQSASPPLSRAPSCARATGSRRAAPCSAVTVVSVLASPASTTSGGPQAVLHPRTEPCPLPTVPEVLQLSDALRDDVLPELGVRLEDHEGGSPGCDEGLLGGGCQVGLAFRRMPFIGSEGWIVPLGHHASPPSVLKDDTWGSAPVAWLPGTPDSAGTCPLGGSLCPVDHQQVSQLVFRLGWGLGCTENDRV